MFLVLVASGLTCASTAHGQSIESFINKAGRAIGSTVKSAGSALSDAASNLNSKGKSKKRNRRAAESAHDKTVVVPPLPVRRPRRSVANKKPKIDGAKYSKDVARSSVKQKKKKTGAKPAQQSPELLKRSVAKGTVPVPERKSSEKEKEPEPDVFSEEEIKAAQARCRKLLKSVVAETVAQPPIKKGPCGDPAPVKLMSLGANPKVVMSPPATLNCQMVKALHTWLNKDLQPLSKAYFKSPITKIENMSSYSCRNAYGRTTTKLSEHGKANALDIRGFEIKAVKVARLLNHWGPTNRDIEAARKLVAEREAKRKAAEAEAAAKAKAAQSIRGEETAPTKVSVKAAKQTADDATPPHPVRKKKAQSQSRVQKLGGPKSKDKPSKKTPSNSDESKLPIDLAAARTPKARFLRDVHKRACKIFGTVLGPEANNAHRNHFHVDLAPRKYRNYCR